MGGLYDILESYRQQNDPRFVYEGLYEEPAYTGPNIDPMYNLGARQFGNMDRMTGIMQQAPLQNLGIDTSYGVANEEDVEQEFLPDQKKSSGLADLFRTLIGFAVPGSSFFLNQGRGALDGIKSLNQRLRNTDFAKSSSLADYFDARSYGGRDARDRAASQNMREARAIQRQVDMRPSAVPTNQDRGRGQNFSGPTRSAAATRSRDLGSMRGGVGR